MVCAIVPSGRVVRNFLVAGKLLAFLWRRETSFPELPEPFRLALRAHSKGEIDEIRVWDIFEETTGTKVPKHEGSLLGRFFEPTIDLPTLAVVTQLKQKGHRVICGTNVNESHYTIHQHLHQYDIFDYVHASHHMHSAKPDGSFYRIILEKERLEPNQLFFTDAIPLQTQLKKLKILH